jgi:protein-S-isoprenylcysteine O-methyltransferase Ste14
MDDPEAIEFASFLRRTTEAHMTAVAAHLAQAGVWHIFSPTTAINTLWLIFIAYWVISALKRKKTKSRESFSQRLSYVIPLVLMWVLLFRGIPHLPWLNIRFVPDLAATEWIGVFLTAAGVAIACWARYHLGTNWSGVVTLKEGHELIRTGPYRNIRHPIYTGILLALLGTAVAVGEIRALIAVAIAYTSFYTKARREESLLAREFGDRFTEHQRQTGMFLPRLS